MLGTEPGEVFGKRPTKRADKRDMCTPFAPLRIYGWPPERGVSRGGNAVTQVLRLVAHLRRHAAIRGSALRSPCSRAAPNRNATQNPALSDRARRRFRAVARHARLPQQT